VDSVNTGTAYGAVLENHEIAGEAYINISNNLGFSAASATLPPVGKPIQSPSRGSLPPRPPKNTRY
jgi:hypothetical protein